MYFSPTIKPADIFLQNGIPTAKNFDDIYYTQHGNQESEHVFLNGNNLNNRFKALTPNASFCIGEMGFGTGLNFLTTLKLWSNLSRAKNTRLLFVSAELHPLTKDTLCETLHFFKGLKQEANQLLNYYPELIGGYHLLTFDSNVQLLLMLGDAFQMWDEFAGKVDAWFLDGFAPNKNPAMWSSNICNCIAEHSVKGETTLSTFSVARTVKDNLEKVGFEIHKQKGFGKKREMLAGIFGLQKTISPNISQPKIGIIGAGLAGLWTASKLKERGINPLVWESDIPASKSSGNDMGLISPYVSKQYTPTSVFLMMSFLYTKHLLSQLTDLAQFNGIEQFAKNDTQHKRLSDILALRNYPSSILTQEEFGNPQKYLLPLAGYALPKKICQHLVTHYNLQILEQTKVIKVVQYKNGWQIHTSKSIEEVDILILANGVGFMDFEDFAHPALRRLDGMIAHIERNSNVAIKRPIKFGRYLVEDDRFPYTAIGGVIKEQEDPTEKALEWLSELQQVNPNLILNRKGNIKQSIKHLQYCERLKAYDHLPIVGLCKKNNEDASTYKNLFLNVGHGSRGITTTPIVGEILACMISKENLPIPKQVWNVIDSQRFIKRKK